MRFAVVSEDIWQLSAKIGPGRRKRLLETPFEEIVQRIVREARLGGHGRQGIKKHPSSKRVLLNLETSAEAIDLFHNGAGGYRAQFLIGVSQGIIANRFVIDALLNRLECLCKANPTRGCTWDFVERSLCDRDAKVWIYQGIWFRQCRLLDRHLFVERWRRNGEEMVLRRRRIPTWAKLTPSSETRLQLKGGCLDEAHRTIGVPTKSGRSEELHCFGYT